MTAFGTRIFRFRSPALITTRAVITLVTLPIGRSVFRSRLHSCVPVAASASTPPVALTPRGAPTTWMPSCARLGGPGDWLAPPWGPAAGWTFAAAGGADGADMPVGQAMTAPMTMPPPAATAITRAGIRTSLWSSSRVGAVHSVIVTALPGQSPFQRPIGAPESPVVNHIYVSHLSTDYNEFLPGAARALTWVAGTGHFRSWCRPFHHAGRRNSA